MKRQMREITKECSTVELIGLLKETLKEIKEISEKNEKEKRC